MNKIIITLIGFLLSISINNAAFQEYGVPFIEFPCLEEEQKTLYTTSISPVPENEPEPIAPQTNELRSTAVAQDLPMPEFTEPGEHVPDEHEKSNHSVPVRSDRELLQKNADPNQKLPPELELLQACITSGCFLMIMRNNNASNPITSTPSNSSGECIFLPKKRDSIPL